MVFFDPELEPQRQIDCRGLEIGQKKVANHILGTNCYDY
jgi:hypothetical protein